MIDYITHFLIGFIMAYVGLLPPGMMNMTAMRNAILHGLRPALQFAAGAASIVLIQAFLALYFANHLNAHPDILVTLKKVAVVVFVVLAWHFFRMSRKPPGQKTKTVQQGLYLAGVAMASMNMLAIPFFFGYSAILELNGWIRIASPFYFFFVTGAAMGAFALFSTYARFATYISARIGLIARNINLILSLLFVVLSVVTLLSLL